MKRPSKRTVTGALFGIIMLATLYAGQYFASVFFFVLAFLSVFEFLKIHNLLQYKYTTITILTASALVYGIINSIEINIIDASFFWYMIAIPWVSSIIILLSQKKNHSDSIAAALITPFLISAPFAFIASFFTYSINSGMTYFIIPVAFFIFLWFNDMFAFFIGKAIGKTPLMPNVSPKKTLEGTIGGLCCSILAGIGASFLFPGKGVIFWVAFAALTAIGAVFGDLLESVMKRRLDIKDSGNILPGHGGFLDRFDSMFMAASLIFVFLKIIS